MRLGGCIWTNVCGYRMEGDRVLMGFHKLNVIDPSADKVVRNRLIGEAGGVPLVELKALPFLPDGLMMGCW